LQVRISPATPERAAIDGLRPDEALVRIVATRKCHTDMVAGDTAYDVHIRVGDVFFRGM
jgi:hypothetical protein